MNGNAVDIYLVGSIGVCALGAIMNAFLVRRRGLSAGLLAVAFIVLGFTIQLYRSGSPLSVIYGGAACVVSLLIVDFVTRAGRQGPGR